MNTRALGVGLGFIGVVLATYGLVKHFVGKENRICENGVCVSLNWDDGIKGQTFLDGSVHRSHLLIENPTSQEMTYYVYLGSDAWASNGPYVAPFWILVWDPDPPHYPIIIPPGGSILWENDITMRSTYGQDYGMKDVGVQVLSGIDPDLDVLIQWAVLDTINLVAP